MEPIGRPAAKIQSDALGRRAVVLVGHGGVPRDYPRERLMQLRALETRRRASGAPPSQEEVALEHELRHWPRTQTTPRKTSRSSTVDSSVPSLRDPAGRIVVLGISK